MPMFWTKYPFVVLSKTAMMINRNVANIEYSCRARPVSAIASSFSALNSSMSSPAYSNVRSKYFIPANPLSIMKIPNDWVVV